MSSGREAALAALCQVLTAAFPPPGKMRRETLDAASTVPTMGAMVTMSDGSLDAEPLLSPLSYDITHTVPITVDAILRSTVDDALVQIAAALDADRTLGGTVEWAEVGPAEVEVQAPEGPNQTPMPRYYGGLVSITLTYTAPTALG